jgi:hypothetical protein
MSAAAAAFLAELMLASMAGGADPFDSHKVGVVGVVSVLSHSPAGARLGVGVELLEALVEAGVGGDPGLRLVGGAAGVSAVDVSHESDRLAASLAGWSLLSLSHLHSLKNRAALPPPSA